MDEALKYFKESLVLAKKNPKANEVAIGMTMRKIGNIQVKKSEFNTACSYFRESLQLFSNRFGADSIEVTNTLLDTAYAFHRLRDHQKVIYCCSDIRATNEVKFNEAKNSYKFGSPLGKCLGLAAVTHEILNETTVAMTYFEQSIHTYSLCLRGISADSDLNVDERESFLSFASILVRKAKLNERIGEEDIAMGHYKSKATNTILVKQHFSHNFFIF